MRVPTKRLPPRNGHIEIPVTSRRDALAGLSLYTASRSRALFAQQAAWWLVNAFGPHALPGRSRDLDLPFPPEVLDELADAWRPEVGTFDSFAAHLRRPMARSGFALLLIRDGSPIGFVKLRRSAVEFLVTEHTALVALSDTAGLPFTVPRPLATGSVAGWNYLLMSALPSGVHRPANDIAIDEILDGLAGALHDAIPRQVEARSDWEPMHADFTPWNLRSAGVGKPVLLDWEDATWGPPRADALWYEATRRKAQLRLNISGGGYTDEVRTFWTERLSAIVAPGDTVSIQAYTLALLRNGQL